VRVLQTDELRNALMRSGRVDLAQQLEKMMTYS